MTIHQSPQRPRLGVRILMIELRRSNIVWIVLGLTAIGTVLLVAKHPPFQQYSDWTSTWADGAGWLNAASLVLGPLTGATAAWIAGRETRGHLQELLESTSRPTAQRVLANWVSVLIGVTGGYLAYALVVATAIIPGVSNAGSNRWQGDWLLIGLGWVVCAGVGYAAGRLVGGRLVAPMVGLGLYGASAAAAYFNAQWVQLAPVAHLPSAGGRRLIEWVVPVASLWLLALVGVTLLLSIPGKRRWSILPAIAAIALAVPLVNMDTSPADYLGASWSEVDPSASRLVCTTDQAITVCVYANHSELLPDVAAVAREMLTGPLGTSHYDGAVESRYGIPVPVNAVALPDLAGHFRTFRSGLADPALIREITAANLSLPRCADETSINAFYSNNAALLSYAVAAALIGGSSLPPSPDPSLAGALLGSLRSAPSASQNWVADYLDASIQCDVPALARIGQRP